MNNTTNTAGHRSLYEVTGDIKDTNTMLVPRAALAAPVQAVPASVIMASVMRDDGGEHPAFCLMVAYRAEKDAKAALAMLTDEPAQQAAPDMTDAYAGAREDLSIWKKRALEAEALNRKFAASVNSPSFMGEPAEPVDADTGRLNWLERHSDGFYNLDRISSIVGKGFLTGPFTLGLQTNHATLREAIDAARAAQKGTNG